MLRVILGVIVLWAIVAGAPARAQVDLQYSPTCGKVLLPRTAGGLVLNGCDRTLSFARPDGSLATTTLLNALPAGRRAVEAGVATDLGVVPSFGATTTLGDMLGGINRALNGAVPLAVSYAAMGDSITAGCCTSVPALTYVNRVAARLGVTATNRAVSGSLIQDTFPGVYAETPSETGSQLYTLGIGTNEGTFSGTDASRQRNFQAQHQAALAWLALPSRAKLVAQQPAVTLTVTALTAVPASGGAGLAARASVTTAALHGLATGQAVTVAGAGQAPYNVTAPVTVTGPTTFTYPLAALPASPATTSGAITARTAGIAYAGSWANEAVYGGRMSRRSSVNGSTATFPCYGPVCYLAYGLGVGDTGAFSVAVDGVAYGSYGSSGVGAAFFSSPVVGVNRGSALARLSGLADGPHTVTVTVTSATGSGSVMLDWVGAPGAPAAAGPTVVAVLPPRQPGADDPSALYAGLARQDVATLAGDGLNAVLAEAAAAVDPATDLNPDRVHPNDAGHARMAEAVLAAVNPASSARVKSQLAAGRLGVLRPTDPADGLTVGGTAISAILGGKAPVASPTFSGTVTAPAFTGEGSALTVRDAVGNVPLSLRDLYSGAVYAALYGVVGDYNFGTKTGTDNTIALGRAIAAAQSGSPQGLGKRLLLPSGAILTDPQVLSGQIAVEGQSSWATALVLKSGSKAPLITIQPGTSYNFPVDGYPNGGITLSRLRLTSVDSKAAAATFPNAHGIKWITGTWSAQIRLSDVTIYGMPADGLNAIGAIGDLLAERTYFVNNGGRGTNSNSNNDWEFINCQWSINEKENFLSSGDTSFFFLNPNIYSSKTTGLNAYNSDIKIFGGSIDRNGQHGLLASAVALNGSPYRITAVGTSFGLNGASAPNVYADIFVPDGSSGEVFLSQARFGKTYPAPQFPARNNVQFASGATTRVTCRDCVYGNGSAAAVGVTNTQSQFITQ